MVFDDVAVPASYRLDPPAAAVAAAAAAAGNTAAAAAAAAAAGAAAGGPLVRLQPGDYAAVEITAAGGTLRGRLLARTTLQEFVAAHGSAAPLAVFGTAAAAADGEALRMAL